MKVLKFGAVWCPGCLVMKPLWEEIEKDNDWLETEFLDADDHPDLMKKYEINDLPCFVFLDKDGVEIDRLTGEFDRKTIEKYIKKYKNK